MPVPPVRSAPVPPRPSPAVRYPLCRVIQPKDHGLYRPKLLLPVPAQPFRSDTETSQLFQARRGSVAPACPWQQHALLQGQSCLPGGLCLPGKQSLWRNAAVSQLQHRTLVLL